MSSPAVFLDKDGTLIENVPYNIDPALIRLADGALQSLDLLQQAGYQVIVVSNQSGVARGYFGERDLIPVESRLRQQLAEGSVALSGFYYCPHHPEGALQLYSRECVCRKPKPGMLFEAARHHRINLSTSWLIGDILDDIESGNRAGCRTILLDNDHETEWRITPRAATGFHRTEFVSGRRRYSAYRKICSCKCSAAVLGGISPLSCSAAGDGGVSPLWNFSGW